MDYQEISDTLKMARQAIQSMVKTLPSHDEFLRQNCRDENT
jgi:tryptophan halogenase